MALVGCSATTKFVPITPTIPDSLRTCRNAPVVPGQTGTQKDVARYVKGLAGAYLDCKEKLKAVIVIVDNTALEARKIEESEER